MASSQSPPSEMVQLRIELQLPDAPSNGSPRQIVVNVQPLQDQSQPQRVSISETEPAELTLPAGRYQITSTEPLDVDGQPYGWDVEVPLMYHTNELRLSQENAVRVSDELPGEEAPAESASASTLQTPPAAPADAAPNRTPNTSSASAATPSSASRTTAGPASSLSSETRTQIEAMLQRWTTALRAHNLNQEMTCYAPQLTAYFRKRDVSKDFVRRDKERFLERYPEVRHLSLSNINIFQGSEHPEVTALKTWSFGGHRDWTGQVITHLQLEKQQGRWVIVSERERLVHQDVPFVGVSSRAEDPAR